MPVAPPRPRSTLFTTLALWLVFYCSFTLFTPPLLDDADSVHAEVARELLLRHDPVTLYANGIRYLEKAPLLYWAMAASMRMSQAVGAGSPTALAAAARIPLALVMLALALLCEAFARRQFGSTWAGLYAALIVLSSFGLFLFSHITLPDAAVCLWLTVALYAFWRTEQADAAVPAAAARGVWRQGPLFAPAMLFAIACALNVLTKGLIGVVFPLGIVLVYLLLTRGVRGSLRRIGELHPLAATAAFLAVATPWHLLAGLANPTQGQPAPFTHMGGHWQVPLPTDGNVRGWFWFYFMNEHLLRYLNLRIPRDYDTVPLWLFWGLCFVWIMPWSAFAFQAARWAVPVHSGKWRDQFRRRALHADLRAKLLLALAVAFVLLFFSLSTRQEYYVLPALPAAAILLAGYFGQYDSIVALPPRLPAAVATPANLAHMRRGRRTLLIPLYILLGLGAAFALAATFFVLHTRPPAPGQDLAALLAQNPGDYALSMGHFLDLNAQALGLFRLPLALAALGLFAGPFASLLLRRRHKPHAATLALAAGAFTFLLAADLGLRTFSPTLTSAQLARAIAPQVGPDDLVVLHGEYEAGSTLGFYLQRPARYDFQVPGHPKAWNPLHILEGRSSNLWYGSFFPDAPALFETRASLAAKWPGAQRIFVWHDTGDRDRPALQLPGPVYVVAESEGKQILSNQPNH